MGWYLSQSWIMLILAFALGVLAGWMLWRLPWRKRYFGESDAISSLIREHRVQLAERDEEIAQLRDQLARRDRENDDVIYEDPRYLAARGDTATARYVTAVTTGNHPEGNEFDDAYHSTDDDTDRGAEHDQMVTDEPHLDGHEDAAPAAPRYADDAVPGADDECTDDDYTDDEYAHDEYAHGGDWDETDSEEDSPAAGSDQATPGEAHADAGSNTDEEEFESSPGTAADRAEAADAKSRHEHRATDSRVHETPGAGDATEEAAAADADPGTNAHGVEAKQAEDDAEFQPTGTQPDENHRSPTELDDADRTAAVDSPVTDHAGQETPAGPRAANRFPVAEEDPIELTGADARAAGATAAAAVSATKRAAHTGDSTEVDLRERSATEPNPVEDPVGSHAGPPKVDGDQVTDLRGAENELTRIGGLEPPMAQALRAEGFSTFQSVASARPQALYAALTAHNLDVPASMMSWPRQAQLLADGDETGFVRLSQELSHRRHQES
ncbi:MAG: hypothetical protein CSA58_02765 [Micrococcales bacterium]|nr:MAG: hypothetical protein CSA58_02765 [Micrococcales bacterium]